MAALAALLSVSCWHQANRSTQAEFLRSSTELAEGGGTGSSGEQTAGKDGRKREAEAGAGEEGDERRIDIKVCGQWGVGHGLCHMQHVQIFKLGGPAQASAFGTVLCHVLRVRRQLAALLHVRRWCLASRALPPADR